MRRRHLTLLRSHTALCWNARGVVAGIGRHRALHVLGAPVDLAVRILTAFTISLVNVALPYSFVDVFLARVRAQSQTLRLNSVPVNNLYVGRTAQVSGRRSHKSLAKCL